MSQSLPQQFEEFGEARRAGFLHVKNLKDSGLRVAGVFCTFTPQEILDAAGFTAVGLCGMSNETVPDAEAHLPKNLCPLIKSSYGFALTEKCPYTYFSDLIVGESTCDGKKKMYELLGKRKPTYVLNLPQNLEGDPVEAWTGELNRFIRYLEEHFSVTVTDEALREACKVRNAERLARLQLMQIQRQVPPPAWGSGIIATMDGSAFLFDPAERISKINALRENLLQAAAEGNSPVPAGAKRILVTGCPIGGVLEKTVKVIERTGGVVVCFENCSGIKAAFQMVDTEAEDIVRAIAERYLQIGCAVMSPNPNRISLLAELVEEFAIDGVIEVDLQACTPYTVESFTVREQMREKGIPYLALETDYSQSDSGQLATRIEAFLETLD